MNLKIPVILSEFEDYISLRAIKLPFGLIAAQKNLMLEFVDKIYTELPADVMIARQNGCYSVDNAGKSDLGIYDLLKGIEIELYRFNIMTFSILQINDLKNRLEQIKNSYNALIRR